MSDDQTPPMTGRERQIAALEKHRGATQYGGERANPTGGELGNPTGSLRAAARHMLRQKMIKATDGKMSLPMPAEPTAAQYAMANVIAKATRADMRAIEYLTEQVDGKVVQLNLNAELAALDGMSPEELANYDKQLGEQLAALERAAASAEASRSAHDEDSPAAGDGDVTGEIGGSNAPVDAPSV